MTWRLVSVRWKLAPSTKRPSGVLLLLSHIAIQHTRSPRYQYYLVYVLFFLVHSFTLCIVAAYHTLVSNTAQHLSFMPFSCWQVFVLWYMSIWHVRDDNTIRTFCDLRNVCMGPNQLTPSGNSVLRLENIAYSNQCAIFTSFMAHRALCCHLSPCCCFLAYTSYILAIASHLRCINLTKYCCSTCISPAFCHTQALSCLNLSGY